MAKKQLEKELDLTILAASVGGDDGVVSFRVRKQDDIHHTIYTEDGITRYSRTGVGVDGNAVTLKTVVTGP